MSEGVVEGGDKWVRSSCNKCPIWHWSWSRADEVYQGMFTEAPTISAFPFFHSNCRPFRQRYLKFSILAERIYFWFLGPRDSVNVRTSWRVFSMSFHFDQVPRKFVCQIFSNRSEAEWKCDWVTNGLTFVHIYKAWELNESNALQSMCHLVCNASTFPVQFRQSDHKP